MIGKAWIEWFNLCAILTIIAIPFLQTKGRGIVTLGVITLQVILSSVVAFTVFRYGEFTFIYKGSAITGEIPVRIDALSACFMLIISFTFLTGAWYGFRYMSHYSSQTDSIAMHAIAFVITYTSLIDICLVQNGFVMLVIWEAMALGSFVLVIFEHQKSETIKAGINYLIQSHVCILFLTLGFMLMKVRTGSFDFLAINEYSSTQSGLAGLGVFIIFFAGFAVKAGFVPFHTWLPLAHPAAPAHISGIMSGVIIKIGIYGILRFILLVQTDMVAVGYFIISISVITGVYGVMLAIVQHNLKRLLAYHSIENIGIIGIGIGLGCLGLGYENSLLVIAGFCGAILHTFNHSLFKSLLFFTAGNVYQATHTMNIEKLGGLLKQIPRTGYLFLLGSLAICGLPPFNGFVSEFFIYYGLYHGLISEQFTFILFMLFTILGLVLIGGLALICFTKAFGVVFLGNHRDKTKVDGSVERSYRIFPLSLIALLIVLVGLLPMFFVPYILKAVDLYQHSRHQLVAVEVSNIVDQLTHVGYYSLIFVGITFLLFLVRRVFVARRKRDIDETWGCGYTGETDRMQYTASSFVRTYRKLAEPLLFIKKEKKDAVGLYPEPAKQVTHPGDKIENWLIDRPVFFLRGLLNRFVFLQNGNIQYYILYGFIFIGLAILLPMIITKFIDLIHYLNQL